MKVAPLSPCQEESVEEQREGAGVFVPAVCKNSEWTAVLNRSETRVKSAQNFLYSAILTPGQ